MRRQIKSIMRPLGLRPWPRFPFVRRLHPHRLSGAGTRVLSGRLAGPCEWSRVADHDPGGALFDIWRQIAGGDKWPHYFPIYERAMAPYRDHPIRMLEIGVYNGASLKMWNRYLHAGSTVIGIDIDPRCQTFADPAAGVHVRIGPQQDSAFLRSVVRDFGPFDVVIDDGSHVVSHMIDSFNVLFAEGMASRALYVVEDTHTNYWDNYRDRAFSFIDLTKHLIDAMHEHYRRGGNIATLSEQTRPSFSVPTVTTMLEGIEVYDSVVIFHRNDQRTIPRYRKL